MKTKTCGECRYYHPVWEHEGVCTIDEMLDKACDWEKCNAWQKKEPLSNGDKIRQGNNRELAEDFVYETGAMWASTLIVDKTFDTYEEAIEATEEYLNAPAESDGREDK